MKNIKIVSVLGLIALLFIAATPAKKGKPVYAFGVSTSFADSIVYFTTVHALDDVVLEKKGLLPDRELYSYQLKNFVEIMKERPHQTSMIYFSTKKSKLEKEAAKVKKKMLKNKSKKPIYIGEDEFVFSKPELE